jgi:hypothetical protein
MDNGKQCLGPRDEIGGCDWSRPFIGISSTRRDRETKCEHRMRMPFPRDVVLFIEWQGLTQDLSLLGACADAHRFFEGFGFSSRKIRCDVMLDMFIARHYNTLRQVLEFKRRALAAYSTGVEGSLKELELADFNARVCVIGFVHVVGEKPILNAQYNGVAEAGCSGRLTVFAMNAWVRRMHPHSLM